MADALAQGNLLTEFKSYLFRITRNAWRRFCVTGLPTTNEGERNRGQFLSMWPSELVCLGHSSSEIRLLKRKKKDLGENPIVDAIPLIFSLIYLT